MLFKRFFFKNKKIRQNISHNFSSYPNGIRSAKTCSAFDVCGFSFSLKQQVMEA